MHASTAAHNTVYQYIRYAVDACVDPTSIILDSGWARMGVARWATVSTVVAAPTLRRKGSLGWGY